MRLDPHLLLAFCKKYRSLFFLPPIFGAHYISEAHSSSWKQELRRGKIIFIVANFSRRDLINILGKLFLVAIAKTMDDA